MSHPLGLKRDGLGGGSHLGFQVFQALSFVGTHLDFGIVVGEEHDHGVL